MPNYISYNTSPISYANDLIITNDATTPNTVFNISPGSCLDSTGAFQMTTTTTLNVNSGVTGANGLDTGTVGNNVIYTVYLIADAFNGNPTAGMISTSLTAPVMPFGYNIFRRIGFIRTNGSAQFLKGYWSLSGNTRMFTYDSAIASPITTGAATSFSSFSVSAGVPAINYLPVILSITGVPSAANRTLFIRPYGSASNYFAMNGQVATVSIYATTVIPAVLNSGDPTMQYTWSAGGGDSAGIYIQGYYYSI